MKKNTRSTKQRKAQAKKGLKKFAKEKKSSDEKHIRVAKRKMVMDFKRKKLEDLIGKLSGDGSAAVDAGMRDYMASAPVPPVQE